MSATVVSDPISAAAAPESQTSLKMNNQTELEFAKCDCCGLTEECTLAYIARIRERFQGRWICGLCAEAVKDEICRSEMFISMEEALNLHMNFCIYIYLNSLFLIVFDTDKHLLLLWTTN